ncbi:MAG: D-alanine--D-alanine ligase [Rubrivivax sp.]|nr:D-alanine--D-alanine ligase [Rubrivivax sp.]MCL4698844.1 D-alanine--D-alanine ligase [Burkholderiaceae bacterium]
MNAAAVPAASAASEDIAALGKVAVLMGGKSAEREISLMSGGGVLAALQSQGVDAHAFDPADRDLGELKRDGYARVFIALHGRHGEDGTVQGALELLGIPYTGSGVLASAIALDKVMTKRLWLAEGLPTPNWVCLEAGHQQPVLLRAVPDDLGLPLIVKPPREGSSIGVTKVMGYSEMQAAVALAAQYDADVLCEEFVDGIELTCPVIGEGASARALPVVRIDAPAGNYDYEHKYFSDDTGYRCPSGLPPAEEAEVQRLTMAAYRALGCRGWGRADLMQRASDGRLFLLEMNTSPGMTSHSLVPMSARAAGISYEALCLQLLRAARLDAPAR